MDAIKFTTIAHMGRRFLVPIFPDQADLLLNQLNLTIEDKIVDFGCGKGEFLIRAAEQFGCESLGIDKNPTFSFEANYAAENRKVSELVKFDQADANKVYKELSEFSVGICTGATHSLNGFDRALQIFNEVLSIGGRILIAEGIWNNPPENEYLELLGCNVEDLNTHEENQRILQGNGFKPLFCYESSIEEWDDYEGAYAASVFDYVKEYPDDVDNPAILSRIQTWNDGYQKWGRDTLGLGWYVCEKQETS
jgi:SAM-dependent methyltransferase